jgi:hypothetical protein
MMEIYKINFLYNGVIQIMIMILGDNINENIFIIYMQKCSLNNDGESTT